MFDGSFDWEEKKKKKKKKKNFFTYLFLNSVALQGVNNNYGYIVVLFNPPVTLYICKKNFFFTLIYFKKQITKAAKRKLSWVTNKKNQEFEHIPSWATT